MGVGIAGGMLFLISRPAARIAESRATWAAMASSPMRPCFTFWIQDEPSRSRYSCRDCHQARGQERHIDQGWRGLESALSIGDGGRKDLKPAVSSGPYGLFPM